MVRAIGGPGEWGWSLLWNQAAKSQAWKDVCDFSLAHIWLHYFRRWALFCSETRTQGSFNLWPKVDVCESRSFVKVDVVKATSQCTHCPNREWDVLVNSGTVAMLSFVLVLEHIAEALQNDQKKLTQWKCTCLLTDRSNLGDSSPWSDVVIRL